MNTALLQVILLAGLSQTPGGETWLKVDAQVQAISDADTGLVVGQPFLLRIEVEHSPGAVALLPVALGLPDALAERTSARQHQRTPGTNQDLDVYLLELLAFETGEHEIPALALAIGSTVASSPAIMVTVGSGLSKDEQLVASSTRAEAIEELERMAAAMPPPERVLVPDYRVFWVLGGALLIIVAALVLRRLATRNRAEIKAVVPYVPPRPAHEVAFEALAELKSKDPLAASLFNAHYTELSAILREYVGARYGFDSVELTYDELCEALRSHKTGKLDIASVETLLFTADQVKFAKYVPVREDGYVALKQVEQIVEITQLRPAPEEGTKA